MYVYENNKAALFHVAKCGGSSLREYLNLVFGESSIIRPGQHHFLKEAKEMLNDYTTIVLIRNPFERILSFYAYRKYKYITNRQRNPRTKIAVDLSFKEWLLTDWYPESKKGNTIDQPITDYLLINNKIPNNINIVKLENVKEEMDKLILDKFNIKSKHKIPHINKSKHSHYLDYYDEELLGLVYEWDKYIVDNYYRELTP